MHSFIWMTVQTCALFVNNRVLRIPADPCVLFSCTPFACVAGVYLLLGGVIYQRVTSGAKGIDQIQIKSLAQPWQHGSRTYKWTLPRDHWRWVIYSGGGELLADHCRNYRGGITGG